jgi:hypothetical protein
MLSLRYKTTDLIVRLKMRVTLSGSQLVIIAPSFKK